MEHAESLKVVDGPSLLDLNLSLLQGTGHIYNNRRLTVEFKVEKVKADEDVSVTVAVSGLEKERGNRQWWIVTGYVQGYNPLGGADLNSFEVTIHFDVNKRKGYIELRDK